MSFSLFGFISISVVVCSTLGADCHQNYDVTPGKVWRVVNRTLSGGIPENICKIHPCLPKCCAESERITEDGLCQTGGQKIWNISEIPVHKRCPNGTWIEMENSQNGFTVLHGIPCPFGSRYLLDNFKILQTGNVFDMGGNIESKVIDYCVDHLNSIDKIVGFVCFPTDVEEVVSYRYYPIGMLCSVVFLSATLLVYCLLPELRNIHGLCLMCHMLSLTIGYIFLAIVQLGGSGIPLGLCKLLAYTVVFFFLASFYWLNVMCFDIWWVFCGFRKSQMQPSKRGMDSKKFLYYSIYSWGSATAIIILVIATESLPFISEQWLLPKPDFGKTKCWFESKPAMWTYFYGPMASILVANLFFFMTTIHKILKISKETRVLTHDGNKRHDEKEKQRYMLYFKLFLVMGITWVSEVVSFHFSSRQPSFVWIITDVCNTLQGIPIFFIFVWKKKTLRLLNDRFCPSIRLMDASQTSTKTRETTNVTNNNIHPTEPAIKQRVTKIDSSFEMKNLSPQGNLNGER